MYYKELQCITIHFPSTSAMHFNYVICFKFIKFVVTKTIRKSEKKEAETYEFYHRFDRSRLTIV